MSKLYFTVFLSFIVLFTTVVHTQQVERYTNDNITVHELQQHIKYLASEELGGRLTGEQGNRLAAQYIANEFKSYGLLPIGDNGTYFQNFTFVSSVKEGKNNSFIVSIKDKTINFRSGIDFRPLSFSADTTVSAPLVFVGYGISSDSINYDDYKNVDVKNKIAVILRYSPAGSISDSTFAKYTPYNVKAFTARNKGAVGIVLITGPVDDEEASLIPFKSTGIKSIGISAITMKWNSFDSLLKIEGKDLKTIQRQINITKVPNSFELKNAIATIQTEVIKIQSNSANILGYLDGTDSLLKNEVLIIGAHMDHIGMGGEGSTSLCPDTVVIHPGADDNASGTAALLELAQYFSARKKQLKRSILFASFSGEELGVLGSTYYVNNPKFSLEKTIAMINMDMIGRMRDSVLVIEGTGTTSKWEKIIEEENKNFSFKLKLKPSGFGPSDNAPFYSKNIPVLFFFTNIHNDYHKPSDTWDKINYSDEKRIIELIANISEKIINDEEKPVFMQVTESHSMSNISMTGARASLGVIPDFAEDSQGFKISGVRPGSAADKGGLKGGDIIIKFDGKDIKNIYDYTYLLGQYKPNDEVNIVVKRGNEILSLHVKLEKK